MTDLSINNKSDGEVMDKITGQEVKREIIAKRYKDADRIALLSGFVRVGFSVLLKGTERNIAVDCQSDFVREFIVTLMMEQFKLKPIPNKDLEVDASDRRAAAELMQDNAPGSNKNELRFPDCGKILNVLNIIDGDDYFDIKGIDNVFRKNTAAYVRGMFLGCGSLSVPKTDEHGGRSGGYHIEFALGSEELANDLISLLKEYGISAKQTLRAEKYVVYAKEGESVSNCLALLGAEKTVLTLNNTMAWFDIKDNENRRTNCDVANINRSVNAAVDVSAAIDIIERKAGLSTLDGKLYEAACARKINPQASLGDLAEKLGISKSGLKHRYDKISEIAAKLENGGNDKLSKK